MIPEDVINIAAGEVGYHEKVWGTPDAALYPKRNAYDGEDNWTKYHRDINVAQGGAWCGYFLYWCFFQLCGSISDTNTFLHGIINKGAGVDDWYTAFNNAGKFHYKNSGYIPKPGDAVVFSDAVYTYSHVELIVSVSGYPSYITNIGGNTRYDPSGSGTESDSAWVARRDRSVTATSGFHILGYCEIDYDGIPESIPDYMYGWILQKKKRHKWIW